MLENSSHDQHLGGLLGSLAFKLHTRTVMEQFCVPRNPRKHSNLFIYVFGGSKVDSTYRVATYVVNCDHRHVL